MRKWLRWTLVVLGVIVVLLVASMALAPGFIKDYIEENDLELVGREMYIEDISIGWFSGKLGIAGFEMREADGATAFLKADNLHTKLAIAPLFRNHIHLTHFHIEGLEVHVVQHGEKFNFDDLAATDSAVEDTTAADATPWAFTMEDFALTGARIIYSSDLHPGVQIDSLMVRIPIITHDMSMMDIHSQFALASGGGVNVDTHLDLTSETYAVHFGASQLDMALVQPYFTSAIALQSVEGKLDADLNMYGSWADTDVLNLSGNTRLQHFKMTDPRGGDLVVCDLLEVVVDTVVMKEAIYNIEEVRGRGFYSIFELYDEGDNFSNLLVADTAVQVTDSLAAPGPELDYANPFSVLAYYIQDIARSYKESSYRLGRLDISESAFQFNDYTLTDPFRYSLTALTLTADSLNSDRETITTTMAAVLNNAGTFEASITAFTDNLANMDIHYTIRGAGLSPFAPYTSHYVAHPITTGEVLYECSTTIRDGIIDSKNIIVFKDFAFGRRSEAMALYDMPVRLAVSLLKDMNGEIHIDLPIEGNLNDPDYRIGKVIWNTVKNLLLKAVTAPYRLLARTFSVNEDDLKQLHFNLLQREVGKDHQRQLNDLSKVLKAKPELNVEFKRVSGKFEEVERYAITEAKRRYLYGDTPADSTSLNKEDQASLRDYDIKDSIFVAWLDARLPTSAHKEPVQRKCLLYVGEGQAIAAVDQIGNRRSLSIRDYLSAEGDISTERMRFTVVPDDSLITSRSTAIYNVGFWMAEE